jgi:hypothetical protein
MISAMLCHPPQQRFTIGGDQRLTQQLVQHRNITGESTSSPIPAQCRRRDSFQQSAGSHVYR